MSIIRNERGTVISDGNDNRNRSNGSENDVREEERMIGGGDTHSHTLTHSLTLSQILSLNTIYHLLNHNILFLYHNYSFL